MKSRLPLSAFIAALLCLSTVAFSQSSGAPAIPEHLRQAVAIAREAVEQDLRSETACSAAVAIIEDGTIVYSETFGLADRENRMPVSADTLFNIGSISKAFTTSAMMALVDQGKVGLDVPLLRYLPEFAMADPRFRNITVRMLLNHTSGISGTNWENGMGFESDPGYARATLKKLQTQRLKFDPGAVATYCNDGFTLAELVIERVSGMSFIDYVAQRILSPLAMARTGLSMGLRKGEPSALYYEPGTGKKEPVEVVSILGAGGMASTAEDLCRFAYSFSGDGPQFLSPESRNAMLLEQPSAAKRKNALAGWPYGLGWDFVEKAPFKEAGIQVLGKGGNTGRYTSQILVAPSQRIAVAIVESAAAAPAVITAARILEAALADKGLMGRSDSSAALEPAREAIPHGYAEFEGYYAAGGYVIKLDIDFDRNELSVLILYQGRQMPRPPSFYSGGAFYSSDGDPVRLEKIDGTCCFLTETPFGPNVAAQRLEVLDNPQNLDMEIAGRLWLRRNIGPYEGRSLALFNPFTVSNPVPTLPGYVDFDGIKEVTSPSTATFVATYVRDQTELSLVEKEGETQAWLSYKLLSPADEALRLSRGFSAVTIGSEGLNEWLVAAEDLTLQVRKPGRGRLVVYSPGLAPLYDSVLDTGEVKVGDLRVEKGSLIQLAGLPGDRFALTALTKEAWTFLDTMSMWDIADVDVSPDGKKIIFTASTAAREGSLSIPVPRVYIADIDGKNQRALTGDDIPSYHAQWSPDGRHISFLSFRSGTLELWLTSPEGGEPVQLSHANVAVYAYRWARDGSFIGYIDPDPVSPEEIRAAQAMEDPQIVDEQEKMIHLWTVATEPDAKGLYATTRITSGDFCVSSWDFSPDGSAVTFVRQKRLLPLYEYPGRISRLDLKSGIITDLVPPIERGIYNFISYSPDGASIAYSTSRSFFTLMDVSVLPSAGGTPVTLAKDQSQSALYNSLGLLGWSPDGAYLYISNARGTKAAITALPVDGGPARDILVRGYISGGKINAAGTAMGLIFEDLANPSEIWAAALSGKSDLEPWKVSALNAKVPKEKIWESEVVEWKASDGRAIEGILTYPAGERTENGFPLVVEAHGGPSYSFFEYYPGGKSWLISPAGALAYQGFALLRPNIRGSAGYGAEFTYSNLADWGGGDFQDILDGVDFLVERGMADPERVTIMGQSYGGYMAAWAVTQTDRFKASVVIDGITNLASDALTTDIPHYMADNLGGFLWDNPGIYRDRSPVTHVRNVRTPTLILHGMYDARVPLGQAQEFHTALKLLNVPTRMIVYPRAGHYPGEPKQQVDMWEREIEWFMRYIGK